MSASVHYSCLLAYQSQIQALGLDGIVSRNIIIAWMPNAWTKLAILPAVVITPMGTEGQPGTLSGADDIEYPCLIAIVAAQDGLVNHLEKYLLWRQRIFRAFRHQRLSGVTPPIITTDVDLKPVFEPQWFMAPEGSGAPRNVWYSAMVMKPRSRELRG